MNLKDTRSKGLVLVGVLLLFLTLSGYVMLRLNSAIIQVGTSRWVQYDVMSRDFTIGGADGVLSIAVKNPLAFQYYMKAHNFTMNQDNLGSKFIGNTHYWNDAQSDYLFPTKRIRGTFTFKTSSPMIAGGVPGYEEGKYCYLKYLVNVKGELSQLNADGTIPAKPNVLSVRHLIGSFLIGPVLCK